MKRFIISLLFSIGISLSLCSQEIETIYLKDGSILKGYMSSQEPGKMIMISSKDAKVSNEVRKVSEFLYEIAWNDIVYIEKANRPENLLTGTICEVVLKDGKSYKGYIKEIHPANFMKFYTEDNVMNVLSYSDISTIIIKEKNDEQPIKEQFYYKDIVVLKNNDIKRGFIVRQEIGKSISILTNGENLEIVPLCDIYKLKKEYNGDYRPIWDILLSEGQFVYDSVDVKFQNIERTVTDLYIIDTDTDIHEANVGEEISIYANLRNDDSKITALKTQTLSDKATLIGKKKNYYETFKIDDFINSNIIVSKSNVSKNGTTEISFVPSESGYYVLYVSEMEGFIVFKVS